MAASVLDALNQINGVITNGYGINGRFPPSATNVLTLNAENFADAITALLTAADGAPIGFMSVLELADTTVQITYSLMGP